MRWEFTHKIKNLQLTVGGFVYFWNFVQQLKHNRMHAGIFMLAKI